MKQTENYNLNLIENTDKILDSLSALNVNFTSIDTNLKNKSDFDGSYESLKDKPSIPTKTSELENDSGFAPVIISTTDLEDGVSELATGTIYIVYEE